MDNRTGKRMAVKRMRCQSSEQLRRAQKEIETHRELSSHPYILPLLDWGTKRIPAGHIVDMLFPLCKKSLRQEIDDRVLEHRSSPWTKDELVKLFRGVCHGLKAMHDHSPSWAHRDLKPDNILLDHAGRPMIMDFGSVEVADVKVTSRSQALLVQETAAEHCTMPYRAPELFDVPSDVTLNARADIWSLGCVLFAMMYGYSPFECEFHGKKVVVVECTHLRVIGRLPEPPEELKRYPAFLEALTIAMLRKEYKHRPNVDRVLRELDTPDTPDTEPGSQRSIQNFAQFPPV
uniref:non-specific serine/threonine protein kinase n=1 Tax=Octactis speculum TaxID=3111310 RepID=A0A7S2D3I4_9STRA